MWLECDQVTFKREIISEPYRIDRIVAYIDPFNDPLGSGFQIIQSLFALSPGGILGKGINSSIQKHYYLPEPQTDFIFAIIAEEYGLIGCLIIIILFGLLFYYGLASVAVTFPVLSDRVKWNYWEAFTIQDELPLRDPYFLG